MPALSWILAHKKTFLALPVAILFVGLSVWLGVSVSAWLGERQRLAVVGLAALGIETVWVGRDVGEQV